MTFADGTALMTYLDDTEENSGWSDNTNVPFISEWSME